MILADQPVLLYTKRTHNKTHLRHPRMNYETDNHVRVSVKSARFLRETGGVPTFALDAVLAELPQRRQVPEEAVQPGRLVGRRRPFPLLLRLWRCVRRIGRTVRVAVRAATAVDALRNRALHAPHERGAFAQQQLDAAGLAGTLLQCPDGGDHAHGQLAVAHRRKGGAQNGRFGVDDPVERGAGDVVVVVVVGGGTVCVVGVVVGVGGVVVFAIVGRLNGDRWRCTSFVRRSSAFGVVDVCAAAAAVGFGESFAYLQADCERWFVDYMRSFNLANCGLI